MNKPLQESRAGSVAGEETIIRAFIAVEINDAVRAGLAGVQNVLKEANGHVSWVQPKNIHGTLVFLGDIFAKSAVPPSKTNSWRTAVNVQDFSANMSHACPAQAMVATERSNTIDAVSAALNRTTADCKSFKIEISGLGFFGSPRFPRIIWAGMTGQVDALIDLQGKLVSAVSEAGLKPDEKPFKPHLTIGRVRSNRNAPALITALEKFKDKSFGALSVQRVVLMKSRLTSNGPEYTLLQAAALGQANKYRCSVK